MGPLIAILRRLTGRGPTEPHGRDARNLGAGGETEDSGCTAALWRYLDGSSASVFAKFLLVSYLRESNGDRRLSVIDYHCSEAALLEGLKRVHAELFLSWLSMPLAKQRQDICMYLADPADGPYMLATLVHSGTSAMPSEANPHELKLFKDDLIMIQSSFGGTEKQDYPPRGFEMRWWQGARLQPRRSS